MRERGLHLADRHSAVLVDFDGDGVRECVAWTAAGHDEAFVWIDRNDSLAPGFFPARWRLAECHTAG